MRDVVLISHDYIHVADLANAHIRAFEHLRRGGASAALNLGTGRGYSVLEVIESARRVQDYQSALESKARDRAILPASSRSPPVQEPS